MQALLVTHASRPFVEAKASLNALENRFSALDRLANSPPFNTLPPVHEAVPFSGMLTLWDIDNVTERPPVLIGEYDPGYKIQSGVFRGDQLLVLGEDRIEVLSPGFRLEKIIEDPWLAGGHTLYCDNSGFAYATSAPANAVLKIDVDAGKVVERIRLPDRYGIGYPLTENDDLRLHFVPTDLQPTHINSAVPCAEGLLVTLLIPGAVGVISPAEQFREIVRGYRGCHGGRIEAGTGLMYFTDSPAGIVWFADYETGQIVSRIKVNSAWAHDADQVGKNVFAVALSDHNRVEMVSRADGSVMGVIDCHPFGASAMFVKAAVLPDAWRTTMQASPKLEEVPEAPPASIGDELLTDPLNSNGWTAVSSVPVQLSPSLHITSGDVQYEYLAEGGLRLGLSPGEYDFDARLVCKVGEATVGILDETGSWVAQLAFDSLNSRRSARFSIQTPLSAVIVVAGHNTRRACPVSVDLERLSLKHVTKQLTDVPMFSASGLLDVQAAGHLYTEAEQLAEESGILEAPMTEIQDRLQAEINKRDAVLKETHDRLQAEINKRDALLRETHDHLQAEVDKRDQTLAELQKQLNERSRR